jgi:hypothetical protein
MIAIVGSNGLIGSYLKEVIAYTHEFNSNNIKSISNYVFDTVYIAAPNGNRLTANANQDKDFESVQTLVENLRRTSIDRVVLIGTVDSVLRNNFPYGRNRLWLEEQILHYFDKSHVLRLSALIHKNIKKNILYDLKHNVYLDKINSNGILQWYDLNNLEKDIRQSIDNQTQIINLVSEPIYNFEIVEKFFPHLKLATQNPVRVSLYPWIYTKEQIFQSIETYLNE